MKGVGSKGEPSKFPEQPKIDEQKNKGTSSTGKATGDQKVASVFSKLTGSDSNIEHRQSRFATAKREFGSKGAEDKKNKEAQLLSTPLKVESGEEKVAVVSRDERLSTPLEEVKDEGTKTETEAASNKEPEMRLNPSTGNWETFNSETGKWE